MYSVPNSNSFNIWYDKRSFTGKRAENPNEDVYMIQDTYVYAGFSLATWKSEHGITTTGPLDTHQVKLLLQDLGVASHVKDPTDRCDWTSPMYSGVNAEGWSDGMPDPKIFSQKWQYQMFST